MSESDDLVIGSGGAEGGRDGSAGYMNADEREVFEEENPELAAYSSLKFKVDDEPEPSEEDKNLSGAADMVVRARTEAMQQRLRTQDYELADGVEQLLDQAEEVAEHLDYDEADEYRQQVEIEALQHAAVIEDEELRQRTFAKLEERVDPDLYEAFAAQWQEAWSQQVEREMQTEVEHAQAEMDRQAKTFEAVVQLESQLLAQMSPLEQHLATELIDVARDDIAQMPPGAAQEAVRTRMEMARVQAAKIEEAHTQAEIVKAWGKTKWAWSGRNLRDADVRTLGLMPDLTPTAEEVHAAHERAQKGVEIDRKAAKRIHKGKGATGAERLQAQTVVLAKKMGVPVHDAATGRRIG